MLALTGLFGVALSHGTGESTRHSVGHEVLVAENAGLLADGPVEASALLLLRAGGGPDDIGDVAGGELEAEGLENRDGVALFEFLFHHVGLDEERVHIDDADAVLHEFNVEGFGEATDGELGGGVDGQVGGADEGGGRGDVDDLGAGGVLEVGQGGVDAVDVAHDVDLEEFLFVLELLAFEFTDDGDTCIVDENVEASVGVLHEVFNGALVVLGVRGVHFALHNVGLVLSPFEVSRTGVGTDEVAFLGESLSDVAADATSGTGNKYGFLRHARLIVSAVNRVTIRYFRW